MTAWGNADLLVELLDRQLEFLEDQQNERRILLLPRWLAFINREPQLQGVIREVMSELKEALASLTTEDHGIRDRVQSIWRDCSECIRESLPADVDPLERDAIVPIEHFDSLAALRPPTRLPRWANHDEDKSETGQLAESLRHWSLMAMQAQHDKGLETDDQLSRVQVAADEIIESVRFHRRKLRMLAENSAGAALYRLTRTMRESNPEPPSKSAVGGDNPNSRLVRAALYERLNQFAAQVHSSQSRVLRQVEADDVVHVAAAIAIDARLVTHELQIRILAGRSKLALVRRYAAQCTAFDAAELRELVQKDTKNAERILTRDFAKYLFQQGLNPVIDPTISGLRPDVVDLANSGSLLYVEAKQYGDNAKRVDLAKAYRQVWTTWGRLANQYAVPEAFLLVFRHGGPRLELPEVLRFNGRTLYLVLADISDRTGSKEQRRPWSFRESELLPEPDAAEAAAAT